MKKLFKISANIEQYIIADDEEEAKNKFWKDIEETAQETVETYLSDKLETKEIYNIDNLIEDAKRED